MIARYQVRPPNAIDLTVTVRLAITPLDRDFTQPLRLYNEFLQRQQPR